MTRLAFWFQAGHDHSGIESIAMEGASNVNVPPWRMGSLEIKNKNRSSPDVIISVDVVQHSLGRQENQAP